MSLTQNEREILLLMAKYSMNITRVAKVSFCSRKAIYDRLMNIQTKTNLNPTDFWGLKLLLEGMDKERNNMDTPNEIAVLNIIIETKNEEIKSLKEENRLLKEDAEWAKDKLREAQLRVRKLNWMLTKNAEAADDVMQSI